MIDRDLALAAARTLSRRHFLSRTATATLSAATVGLLAGSSTLLPRRAFAATEQDVQILNSAIAAEHNAIAAYQVGAESGLLKPDALKLAVQFQGHHKEHVNALGSMVEKLGGTPAAPKAKYHFPVETLKTQEDVLRFAAELEKGAVSAYLGAIPQLGSGDLEKAAASILGDEAMHWATLRYVLGENPVPSAFVS
jgi:hypothetical protein